MNFITIQKNNAFQKALIASVFVLLGAFALFSGQTVFADHEGYSGGYDGYSYDSGYSYGNDGYSYGSYTGGSNGYSYGSDYSYGNDGYSYSNDGYSYGSNDYSYSNDGYNYGSNGGYSYSNDGYSYGSNDGYSYSNDGYSYGTDGYTYGNDGYTYNNDGYTYGNDGYTYNGYDGYTYGDYNDSYAPTYNSGYGSYDSGYDCVNCYGGYNSYTVPTYTVPTYTVPTYTYTPPTYTTPTPVPAVNFSVTCAPSSGTIGVNQSVTWTAQVNGVSGNAGYSWSGSDYLSGNGSTVSKTYATNGVKSATVAVTSGGQTRTATCSLSVQSAPVIPNPLVISCGGGALLGSQQTGSVTTQVNIGQTVTWTAQANGGAGNYTYVWSGTDGLSGNGSGATIAYNNAGVKFASVTVTSGGQNQTVSCSNSVVVNASIQNPNPVYPVFPGYATTTVINNINNSINDSFNTTVNYNNSFNSTGGTNVQDSFLSVTCAGAPSSVNTGETTTWYASVTGGNGNYAYSWSGTDGLSGNGQTVSRSYGTTGTKFGSVTVTSGGQTRTASCSNSIFVGSVQGTTSLNGSCYVSSGSQNVGTNSVVTWGATASGGNSSYYTYSWSGTDGLSGNGQFVARTYTSSGAKTAQVTITSGNETIVRSCPIVTVGGTTASNVTVYRNPGTAPLSSAVYLSQVPYTGISLGWKLSLFVSFLIVVSGMVAYRIVKGQSVQDMVSFIALAENVEESIADIARNNKVLLSQDGIDFITEVSQAKGVSAQELFGQAMNTLGQKGDWVALNREKLSQALA